MEGRTESERAELYEARRAAKEWSDARHRTLHAELDFDARATDEEIALAAELVHSWLVPPTVPHPSLMPRNLHSLTYFNCVAIPLLTVGGGTKVSAAGWAKKLRAAGLDVSRARVRDLY